MTVDGIWLASQAMGKFSSKIKSFYTHLLMTIFKIKIRPHPCGEGTVYVRVSAFKEWIKAIIQEN